MILHFYKTQQMFLSRCSIRCSKLIATPYGCRDTARTRYYRSRSLHQGQWSNQGHTTMLHIYTTQPMSLSSINFLHLTVSEIQPGQDIIGQGHYGNVKGQIKVTPWYWTPTQHPTNVPTKYQLPTPYGFQDTAQTRFYK